MMVVLITFAGRSDLIPGDIDQMVTSFWMEIEIIIVFAVSWVAAASANAYVGVIHAAAVAATPLWRFFGAFIFRAAFLRVVKGSAGVVLRSDIKRFVAMGMAAMGANFDVARVFAAAIAAAPVA